MASFESRPSFVLLEAHRVLSDWAGAPTEAALAAALRVCSEAAAAAVASGGIFVCVEKRGATHADDIERMLHALAPGLTPRDRFAICSRAHAVGCPWTVAHALSLDTRPLTPD